MAEDLLTDGFSGISVTGSVVRIDLVTLKGKDGDGKPVYERTRRLIMPMDGFLRSFGLTEELVARLMEAGVVQKKKPDEPGPPVSVESPDVGSPNFG